MQTVTIYDGGATITLVPQVPDTPPPVPTITNATITPASLPAGGGTVTINATVNDGSATLDGAPVTLPVTRTIIASTSFLLGATGAGGNAAPVSLLVSVAVTPPPPTLGRLITKTIPRPMAALVGAVMPDTSGHKVSIAFNDTGDRYVRGQQTIELAGQGWVDPVTNLMKYPAGFPWGQGVSKNATLRLFIETTDAPQLTFGPNAFTAVHTFTPYDPAQPEYLGTPIAVATVSVPANASWIDTLIDKSAIPEGWYQHSVTGLPAGWLVTPYPVYVRHTQQVTKQQSWMPVVIGSHMHNFNGNRYRYSLVPAKYAPVVVPLPARTFTPIQPIPRAADVNGLSFAQREAACMGKLTYEMVQIFRPDDIYPPSVLPSGLWSTAHIENYFASSYTQVMPPWLVMQGTRGRNMMPCITSARCSTRPTGGKLYGTYPWGTFVSQDNGEIIVEAGYVHDNDKPPYTNYDAFKIQRPPAPVTLRGDWSLIPQARWGYHELWDCVTDQRTTALDMSALPIGSPPEQPHLQRVVKYVTDTKNHRVCKQTYARDDLTRTAQVTEFATIAGGLPWGCDIWRNLLLVTWSGANLIIAYDLDNNGAVVWQVSVTRPEGIRIVGDLALFGSAIGWTVQKLDPATGAMLGKFCDVLHDNNSGFVNLAAAMDTFTPGLNVATVTWSSGQYGWPTVYGPDGKRLAIGADNNQWGSPAGMFCPGSLSYASFVAMNSTRMDWGTVQQGIHRVSARQPSDLDVPNDVVEGALIYNDLGLDETHGNFAFGMYGLDLPWGQYGPKVDAFMFNMGHRP